MGADGRDSLVSGWDRRDGGQTKRSSGAGEASGLRLRRHFPVWSGMWVSAVRPGRSRAGVDKVPGSPPARRPVVPPCCRPVVPSDRFLRSASSVRVVPAWALAAGGPQVVATSAGSRVAGWGCLRAGVLRNTFRSIVPAW